MRLLRLVLNNVGAVKHADIDFTSFSKSSVIVISGPNGSGKSTILNMIPEALYLRNPGPNSFADLTPDGGELDLYFEHGGTRYHSRLESRHRAGKPPAISAFLTSDGVVESKTGKQGDYKAAMAKLCPPYQIYLASAFSAQDGADDLLHMTDGEVKGVLGELLDLGQMDQARTLAKEELSKATTEHKAIQIFLGATRESSSLVEIEGKIESIKATIEENENRISEREKELQQVKSDLEFVEEGKKDISLRLTEVEAELRTKKNIREMHFSRRNSLQEYVSKLSDAVLELEQYKLRQTEISVELSKFKDKDSLKSEVTEATNALDEARESYNKINRNLAMAELKKKSLAKEEAQLAIDETELAKAEDEIQSDIACDRSTAELCAMASMAFSHIEHLKTTIELRKKNIESLEQQTNHLGMYKLPSLAYHEARLNYVKGQLQEAERLESELARNTAIANALEARVNDADKAADDLAKMNVWLKEIDSELAELSQTSEACRLALNAADMSIDKLTVKVDRLVNMINVSNAEARAGAHKLAQAEAELRFALQQEAELKAKQQELGTLAQEIDALQETVTLLGPSGLRVLLLEGALNSIAALTNQLLESCFGDSFVMEIVTATDRADKKGTKEVLQFIVFDTDRGREGPVNTYSGGERVFLKEALSLALTIYSSQRSGIDVVNLCRDECCGALSEENRVAYSTMLRRAIELGKFESCLAVTHDLALKNMADHVIEV